MSAKYIFVTGGVVSGLGKGITAASLGRLLKARGLKVACQKFDPYLNVDPGTMNPIQHGEVYVTDDGIETDLDLGHYERFTDENLNRDSNITSGSVYWSILNRERRGEYLGATVQVIPHVTNEIKDCLFRVARHDGPDVVITEIGGTIGDIESLPFVEAIRQAGAQLGEGNAVYIHVTLLPYLRKACEIKTKPTQHSVQKLLSYGIQPDILVCRTEIPLDEDLKRKISLFCNVDPDCVIENLDADSLYRLPLMLEREGLAEAVCRKLGICQGVEPELSDWKAMVGRQDRARRRVRIALVGKYVALRDSYLSVAEALRHGAIWNDAAVDIDWIQAEDLEDLSEEAFRDRLSGADGILVPGGFGIRGTEGKIRAIGYAREERVPFFGICLGMQMGVIEFARNVAGFADAHSSEFAPESDHCVIDLMEDQRNVENKGGTMRLGAYPCQLDEASASFAAYGTPAISERHRHRWEFNNAFRPVLTEFGLRIAGLSPDGRLVEIVEIPDHPWFVGVQFHPEFKSRPNRPHPLFRDFIAAALSKGDSQDAQRP